MVETRRFPGKGSWRYEYRLFSFLILVQNDRKPSFLFTQKNAPFCSQDANLSHFPLLNTTRNGETRCYPGKGIFVALKIGNPRICTENVVQNVRILPLFDIKCAVLQSERQFAK